MTSENKQHENTAKESAKPSDNKKLLDAGLELKKALNNWEEISQKCQGPSADEIQKREISRLLSDLKNQLAQFEE